jgi:hypothetical protein
MSGPIQTVKNQAERDNQLEAGIRAFRMLIEYLMVGACLAALSLWLVGF